MSEILSKVQKMLNEEKFTHAALNNYSTAQFKELDQVLNEARKENCLDELKELCDDHLSHSKNSIIADYFSGMISLSHQQLDDAVLINLVTIFVDNHKLNIVQYLCERILDFGESKFALRTLSDCYKNDKKDEALYDVWRRLVKVDQEEADIAKALADRAEKEAKMDEAVDYYKKALYRYINKQLFTNVREIWRKLLEYLPDDLDFFLHIQKRVAKNISPDKAVQLLWDLYHLTKKKGDVDTAISIVKMIIGYNENEKNARNEITECFKKKYASHSQLDDYLKDSLSQNYRSIHEAITDFEKHIAFDKGNYVFHRAWGVGIIIKVENDQITINFGKKGGKREMSLKMAVSALQTLSKEHIWVLKATKKKEELHEKVKDDIEWALKTIIKSYDNHCSVKQIKKELVPGVLSTTEWTSWHHKAKQILDSDASFGVDPDNIDIYTVRDRPISIGEKLYNEFKAERKFFNRVHLFRRFVHQAEIENESEYFNEMLNYFQGFLKAGNQDKAAFIASYLLLKNTAAKIPEVTAMISEKLNFNEIFESIDKLSLLYGELKYKDDAAEETYNMQKDFLAQIKLFITDWQEVYIKLFPKALDEAILDALKEAGENEKITAMIKGCFENYKDNRGAVLWFYNNFSDDPLYEQSGVTPEKALITLIHILDIGYREIEGHRNTTENKKQNRQAFKILFETDVLKDYIKDTDNRDSVVRIYTLIEDVKDLDVAEKIKLQGVIRAKYPDYKFAAGAEKAVVSRGLMVTMKKYEEKQKQLAHIQEVEVPANSKEIEFALSLGDLRENAEYKAAKEKQEILNSTVARLKSEIERAQIFDPSNISTDHVSFGTKITLFNESAGISESYTILGPWESDPDNNIISYLSPFGQALVNKTAGEKFEFATSDSKQSYKVEEISAADIARE